MPDAPAIAVRVAGASDAGLLSLVAGRSYPDLIFARAL
jgi:enterochelin esterase-like enzyme